MSKKALVRRRKIIHRWGNKQKCDILNIKYASKYKNRHNKIQNILMHDKKNWGVSIHRYFKQKAYKIVGSKIIKAKHITES